MRCPGGRRRRRLPRSGGFRGIGGANGGGGGTRHNFKHLQDFSYHKRTVLDKPHKFPPHISFTKVVPFNVPDDAFDAHILSKVMCYKVEPFKNIQDITFITQTSPP